MWTLRVFGHTYHGGRTRPVVMLGLAGFVVGVYVLVVLGGGALIGRTDSPSLLLSVLATAVVALGFAPVQAALERAATTVGRAGFLGPNGAGKSTTMRIIVGLAWATSGTATISGRRYVDLPNPGLEVGVCLDASAQHAGRTGREILTIAQRFMGLPHPRVEEMLELVSLTPEEASRRVRDYSLGMRQRLGIATALIGEPEVLILDEPPTALTRPASAGCVACCATTPTAAANDLPRRGHRHGPQRRRRHLVARYARSKAASRVM
jgi:ABC-type ATPase involved in cell division